MATPQRNDRTLLLRELGREAQKPEPFDPRESEASFDDLEEITRVGIETAPLLDPPRSVGQQIGDRWGGMPGWARVLVVVLPVATPLLVELIRALAQ